MKAPANTRFEQNYQSHLKHLKLKGLQPKTIEAYSRAIRRVGDRFDKQIDNLSEAQLTDYFTELVASHSWSTVKLDLYGLQFYYAHVLRKPWVAPGLIKPPKSQRLPDIVTVMEAQRIFAATRVLSYRVFFFTLYSLGLRLGEGLRLQVPAEYFLLTFTLPAEFRTLSWMHQSIVYALLMQCCWETVRTFSHNDKQLQGTPGAIAVLHTNTRRLDYHPHVHLVMPAGVLDGPQKRWRTKGRDKAGYLFNHKALAKVFRAKMLAAIEAAGLRLPPRHPETWVVDCKSVGNGEKALIYLGRYLYRGVIAEKDIVECGNGQVRFRYRNARSGKRESRTVSGAHFLWLVLQHVLPKGFRRARNFGFLHPNCKRLIALLHLMLKFDPRPAASWFKKRAPILCTCCGAVMVIVKTQLRSVFRGAAPVPIVTQGAVAV